MPVQQRSEPTHASSNSPYYTDGSQLGIHNYNTSGEILIEAEPPPKML